jgi:drug/metabolite transporter (DMT)-like permease
MTPDPPRRHRRSAGAAAVTTGRRRWRDEGLAEAVGAGLGFGAFFIFLAETSPGSGLLPLVSARAASVVVLAILALVAGHSVRFPRPALALVLAAGVLDAAANALFLAAVRTGLLSLVAVLSALYPASTILLARVVLGERIGRVQQIGLASGIVGVILIASV